MCTEPSHCQCQVICARLSTYSSTFWEVARSTHPIPVAQSNMDRESNIQTLWMQQIINQKNKLTSFNKCVTLSYTMPSLSITLFSLPSATFTQINLRPRRTQQNRCPISWTISLLIHTRKFNTGQVGCNYPYIPTRHIFQSRRPEAGSVGSIFSAKVHLTPTIQNISCRPPMASYLLCAISCAIPWH